MQAKQTRDHGWLSGTREWGECDAGYVLRCNERFIFELHDWSCKAKCWNQELPEEPSVVFRWKIREEQRFIFYSEWWWTIFFPQVTKEYKESHKSNLSTLPECCFRRNVCMCACVRERFFVCVCVCMCALLQYAGHKQVVTFLGRAIWGFGLNDV